MLFCVCVCVCVTRCSSTSLTEQSSQQYQPSVDTASYQESPLKAFAWAGPTVQRLTLGPASSHVIQQRACFSSAGVYNLNVLRVSAGSVSDIEMVPQWAMSTAPIVIHEAATSSDSDAVGIC